MGCVTRIISVLISVVIIFAGLFTTDRGMFGGNNPEVGIPVILIGAGLFLFIVVISVMGTKKPTAMETFVITIGVTLLAIGVANIKVRVLSVFPIIICVVGVFFVICHRKIAGWMRSTARFLQPRN